MKKYFISFLVTILFVGTCLVPSSIVLAQGSGSGSNNPPGTGSGTNPPPEDPKIELNVKVSNPLKSVDTIPELIAQIIKLALMIGVPILVLVFIWIGFKFVQAQGKAEKIKEAKGYLWWAIVGAFLLLGASVLAEAIRVTVEQLK